MEHIIRNSSVAIISGVTFGVAWWLFIDILAYDPAVLPFKQGIAFLPITLSTTSLVVTALVPNSSLYENFPLTPVIFGHRLIFFFGMTLGFGGVLSAIIISTTETVDILSMYAILGIPISNILVLAANITFKFAVADVEVC